MKRILSVLLTMIMVLSLCACANDGALQEDKATAITETAERENAETVDTSDKIETTVEEKIVTNSPVKENTTENSEEKEVSVKKEVTDKKEELKEYLITGEPVSRNTVREMIEKASLIAVCEYVSPIDVIHVSGKNFTNHKMKVIEVLRGEETKEEITVRVKGGKAGGYNLMYDDEIDFTKGEKLLMFLYNPGTTYLYNTEGDHYFILNYKVGTMRLIDERSLRMEVLKIDGEAYASGPSAYFKVSLESSLDTEAFYSVIVLDGFREILAKMNETVPVNYNYFRDKELENAKENYESGDISKEEYDEILEGSREYATITDRVPFTEK